MFCPDGRQYWKSTDAPTPCWPLVIFDSHPTSRIAECAVTKALKAASVLAMGLSLFCSACGYFKAGRWDDDSQNWHRAFGGPVPNGWSILHSRYWRNPHWSYEAGYYFAANVSREERQALVSQPDLIK